MSWHGGLEKSHEEIRSSGCKKIQEPAKERGESSAVRSVGYAFRHGALGTSLPSMIHRSQRVGRQEREFQDDIFMGILQEMGPLEIRTHVYLNSLKCT